MFKPSAANATANGKAGTMKPSQTHMEHVRSAALNGARTHVKASSANGQSHMHKPPNGWLEHKCITDLQGLRMNGARALVKASSANRHAHMHKPPKGWPQAPCAECKTKFAKAAL